MRVLPLWSDGRRRPTLAIAPLTVSHQIATEAEDL